jgi:hypothetical protein
MTLAGHSRTSQGNWSSLVSPSSDSPRSNVTTNPCPQRRNAAINHWVIQFPPIFIGLWKLYNLSAVCKFSNEFDSRVSVGKSTLSACTRKPENLGMGMGQAKRASVFPPDLGFPGGLRTRRKGRSVLNLRGLYAVFIPSPRPGVSTRGSLGREFLGVLNLSACEKLLKRACRMPGYRGLLAFRGWKAQALFVEECRLKINKHSRPGERWKVQSARILRE